MGAVRNAAEPLRRRLESTMTATPLYVLFSDYAGAVPGASALLVRDGTTIVAAAFGLADLEQSIPTTLATNYRLASVSKQFTAMAVLLLIADGRLALDDRLARFFEDAPPHWQHVTLLHLLTHTAGLLDYEDLIPPDSTAQLRDQDVLDLVRPSDSGYHAPAAGFRYSNTGYCLLAPTRCATSIRGRATMAGRDRPLAPATCRGSSRSSEASRHHTRCAPAGSPNCVDDAPARPWSRSEVPLPVPP